MKRLLLIALVLSFLMFAHSAWAAVFSIVAPSSVAVGDHFLVSVRFDPENENINAIEGSLVVPTSNNNANLEKLRDGQSPVGVWIQRPEVLDSKVVFSGIAPGGFTVPGEIFSIEFTAEKEGFFPLDFSGVKALANDGNGSVLETRKENFDIKITHRESAPLSQDFFYADNAPPLDFKAVVSKAPGVFSGSYFIFFDAHDNGAGISGFEIMEVKPFGFWPISTKKSEWRLCENPCVLMDQSLESEIYAKAIDRDGNYKIIHINPGNGLMWYKNIFVLSGAAVFLTGLFFITIKKLKKR